MALRPHAVAAQRVQVVLAQHLRWKSEHCRHFGSMGKPSGTPAHRQCLGCRRLRLRLQHSPVASRHGRHPPPPALAFCATSLSWLACGVSSKQRTMWAKLSSSWARKGPRGGERGEGGRVQAGAPCGPGSLSPAPCRGSTAPVGAAPPTPCCARPGLSVSACPPALPFTHLPAGRALAVHHQPVWVVALPRPAQLEAQHVVPAHCGQRVRRRWATVAREHKAASLAVGQAQRLRSCPGSHAGRRT